MSEPSVPPRGHRLYQISEDDLAELERVLPELLLISYGSIDNRQRVQWRRIREIVTNIRWNYGPPGEVHVIPANGDEP